MDGNAFADLLEEGSYRQVLATGQEGSRTVSVVVKKIGSSSLTGEAADHFNHMFSENRPIVSLRLEVDGQLLVHSGYVIPEKVSLLDPKWILESSEEVINLGPPRDGNFIYIEGGQYFLRKVIFHRTGQEDGYRYALKNLIFWETGFTPPPLKNKHTLIFGD